MADSYLERVAGELADLALADQASSGDENIVENIGEILGSSSQTLQEAYLTAVRVRRAEARARKLLSDRAGKPAARVKSRLLPDENKPAQPDQNPSSSDDVTEAATGQEPLSEEDAAFADVLNTLDEFLHSEGSENPTTASVQPGRPSQK